MKEKTIRTGTACLLAAGVLALSLGFLLLEKKNFQKMKTVIWKSFRIKLGEDKKRGIYGRY